jgi:hypothetical protein
MLLTKSQFGVLFVALALLSSLFSLMQITNIGVARDANDVSSARQTADREAAAQPPPFPSEELRRQCQIIYILGVEGTMHHGVEPIIEALARRQGALYHVTTSSEDLRYGLFAYPHGHFGFAEAPPIDDPLLVRNVISAICPDDGRKHVVIESTSFPSGGKFHSTSRVPRQSAWHQMTPRGIASSHAALNHPTNLYEFYDAYRPYATIKFVVLHRSFLDTVASHKNFDDGPLSHANVIQGYLILLARFLDYHREQQQQLWTVLDTDKISAKFHEDVYELGRARKEMVHRLAEFLSWPELECPECFDSWIDSTSDYVTLLGNVNVKKLTKQMAELEGVWPPQES